MKHFLLLTLFCSTVVFSQVTNEGKPKSWKFKSIEKISPITMPSFNLKALQKEDAIAEKDRPYRFGYKFETNYSLNNSGTWTTLKNGDRIWRIAFKSHDAQSLNFILTDFFIPKDASLYLYNRDRTDLLGAYTSQVNNDARTIGTWIVKGEEVYLEYYEPKSQKGLGSMTISSVTHGYRTYKYNKQLNDSGDCNLDVDCGVGADWGEYKDVNKKAIGLILNNGADWCSGSLINNTANDETPYFLTANHCIVGSTADFSIRFGWISPDPVCAETTNSTDGPTNMLINGATLKAKSTNADFALIELNNPIPENWERIWAGWDRSGSTPDYVVGIHHPAGDIMKICRDDSGVIKAPNGYPIAQTWEITAEGEGWEQGVTEGGSSGSPLFDQDGKIIGQLYGGTAACSGTNDNNQYDYYGRFDVSWNTGATPDTRLKDWLDPNNTEIVIMDSYPPMVIPETDALVLILEGVFCGNSVESIVRIMNRGTNNLTSAVIEYSYDNGAVNTINWNGNLAQGESEDVTLPVQNLPFGSHNLSVVLINNDDENVENNTSTQNFEILEPYNTTQINLSLTLDDYGSETSWEFRDDSGTILYSGNGYEDDDNGTYNETFNVESGMCYEFEIFDSYGDGICCNYGDGSYKLTDDDDIIIVEGGEFGESESTLIRIGEVMGVNEETLSQVTVSPNPSNGIYTLQIPTDKNVNYSVYNTNGQLISNGIFNASNNILNITEQPNGVYMLQLENKQTFKLIKK